MSKLTGAIVALALSLGAGPVYAQTTTGGIVGRVVDAQGSAVPGVLVQARSADTGFVRTDVSDSSGTYRLAALPVGVYDLTADLSGFSRFESRGLAVNVSRTVTLDFTLQLAGVSEAITVSAALPVTRVSGIGEVVDIDLIQGLPLNGRQFANLAATIPGVGLSFHSDITKSAQYAPQISGGNGRNVNYIVDGGDNNDDTVGGLLQMFPLEAVQEFNLATHRFDAEYGRSSGAVLNVVTKSGTNSVRGSWFTLVRNEALNARTMSEITTSVPKQAYGRYQFGGSIGGPIVANSVHYFVAYERTQQDTTQVVDTFGLFPAEEGVFDVPQRQNLLTGKLTVTPQPAHYLALRYGTDRNSQPSGVTLRTARSAWAESENTYDSLNGNHNWVVGSAALNEIVVQYSRFLNDISAATSGPSYIFGANQLFGGSNLNPQRTEQTKWQFRDDFSWTHTGLGGLGHEFKAGVSWTHEPRLFVLTGQGVNGVYSIPTFDLNGPVQSVFFTRGDPSANTPMEMYGVYVKDDWRVNDRLTLNLGVRWDYVDGVPIDQTGSLNFQAMQAAGRSGRFAGTVLEDFGSEPRSDRDNVQPRLGAVYNIDGVGRDVIRGGWGIYTDFGYIGSNSLVAGLDSAGAGIIFSVSDATGIRKADGTLFRITDPVSTIAHLNAIPPGSAGAAGEVVSPLLEQPYSFQTNLGWAHQLNGSTALTADYVRVDGRDLNVKLRPNVLINGRRNLAGIPIQPQNIRFGTAVSKGSSRYDALILALRRRLSRGVDMTASYTLAKATSDTGTAYDEVAQNLIQDISDPFGPVQDGPSPRTDGRHAVTISGIVQAPWGIHVAPIFFYRSALPVHTFEGVDRNLDGNNIDKTELAYRYAGLSDTGVATIEEIGPCETVNCSRRAPFSQLNLRVSRGFAIRGSARIEAIAEVFNLFNARNPFISLTQNRATGARFMQPSAFAGDLGQPEQRVGQLGFRITF